MNLRDLLEEFFSMKRYTFPIGKRSFIYSFFKNPSKRELREILKEYNEYITQRQVNRSIRFLYFLDTKDIIAWPGYVLHEDAIEDLKKDIVFRKRQYLAGDAAYDNNENSKIPVMYPSNSSNTRNVDNYTLLESLKKYFTLS